MKLSPFVLVLGLIVSVGSAYGQVKRDNSTRPCVNAKVQVDRTNTANVKQECAENISSTVQAGQNNTANTTQRGAVNDNSVDQSGYDGPKRRPVPQSGK